MPLLPLCGVRWAEVLPFYAESSLVINVGAGTSIRLRLASETSQEMWSTSSRLPSILGIVDETNHASRTSSANSGTFPVSLKEHGAGRVVHCRQVFKLAAERPKCGPETLVLYRRRPARLPNLPATHYGALPIQLFEGSRGSEAFMQIQWCGGYEKGFGNRWRS